MNNAGMSPLYDRVDQVTEELYDKVLDVNLKGPFRLTALVGTRMAAGDGGSIIMVSSTAAVRPTPDTIPYSAAKAGLNAMTVGFAHAFGPKVRVNCIQPGPFLTDISKAWDLEEFRERARDDGARARRRARRDGRRGALLRVQRVELHDGRGARRRRRRAVTLRGRPRKAPAEVAPVRAGEQLDWSALEAWLRPRLAEVLPAVDGAARRAAVPERLGEPDVSPAPRRARAGAPPAADGPDRAGRARHEARVQGALAAVARFDRAPRAYLFCDDAAVLGADFFVMERRRGEVVRTDPGMRGHPDAARRIAFALVDAMADLHALDRWRAASAISASRRASSSARSPDGPSGGSCRSSRTRRRPWRRSTGGSWQPARDAARLDRPQRPQARQLPVRSRRPRPRRLDLRLGHDDARRSADRLGTLLNYWPDPADSAATSRGTRPGLARMGLPSRADIVQRYAARSGADLADVPWWEAFALWKTAVVVQQLHRRWVRGESTDPRMATIADRMPATIAAARAVLDRGGL